MKKTIEEQLRRVVENCPLSDEPLTAEQEERFARSAKRIKAEVENQTLASLIRECREAARRRSRV